MASVNRWPRGVHKGQAVLLFSVAFLAACAGEDIGAELPDAVTFREWETEGVRIVESSAEVLETWLPWVVDTLPDLELGQLEGGGPSQFTNIAGIVGLPEGVLVVLDGGSRELRWFATSGEHIRTTGGSGRGPGEFLNPILVPQFQPDSLLIFDRLARTFTWVAIDGSRVRAVGPGSDPSLFAGTPRAADGSRALFSSLPGAVPCPENRHCEDLLLLRWVDVTGSAADTLATDHVRRILNYRESEGMGVLLLGPLDQKGLASAAPDGPVVEGGVDFELRQFDTAGRLITSFRVDAPARQSPQDAFTLHIESSSDPEGFRRILEILELPEAVPAFQDLRVDHTGWYWAELFQPVFNGGPSEWLVFDSEGRGRGMVRLPSELEVHDIGENYILGRWTDELGVEYVRRHVLDRR